MLERLLNGRYKIIWALGGGGFGQTYVAEDTQQSNQTCVVKQFKPTRRDENFLQIARRLFHNEASTLENLGSHPQIPTLLDVFEDDGEFYLVQEYIAGQTLSEELAAVKRMSESQVTALLEDVLNILDFVHQHRVIHRDIKPGNLIRRQSDGKFVLIDFGAVKEIQTQLTATEPGQTSLTVGIGTHGYGPSEQMMGKPRYNSDIYALGMTAIQALTGLQPIQLPTHSDTAEVVWQDQARVSPKLAFILAQMTRYHFNQRYQSAREVLQALAQPANELLHRITDLPPTDTVAVAETTPTDLMRRSLPLLTDASPVQDQRRKPRKRLPITLGIVSFTITGAMLGLRQLGWLQSLELAVFDRMVQISPVNGLDPRLLVVGINDADIEAQKRFPLADRTIAQLLKTLKAYQPRVIGVDLLRDIPQPPGTAELRTELNAPNVIAITQMGNGEVRPVPAPPGVPANRVGFNDLVIDDDGLVRRNLMFAGDREPLYSFSLRLALMYLAPLGILPKSVELSPDTSNRDQIILGKATLKPLQNNSGAYQKIDARGYQILLRYRGRNAVQQVSLSDVLHRRIQPELVRDRIVLVGTTAATGKDLFFTPYSATEQHAPRMPGVILHANLVSQLLDASLDGRSLFWFWNEWVETLWIAAWAWLGGMVAWYVRRPLVLGFSGASLLTVLFATGFGLFTIYGWVPIAAPALAAIFAGGVVLASRPAAGSFFAKPRLRQSQQQ